MKPLSSLALLERKVLVDPMSGCHLWTGCLSRGQGICTYHKKGWKVTRLMWTLKVGPIPEGKVILHNHRGQLHCCAVEHLYLADPSENVVRTFGRYKNARMRYK